MRLIPFHRSLSIFLHNMTSSQLVPPSCVRGLQVLDRSKFSRTVPVPILQVSGENLSKITSLCKNYFLKLENFKPIQQANNVSSIKCIYLNPGKVKQWTDISEEDRLSMEGLGYNQTNFTVKDIELQYENWKYDEIFKAVLPANEETVSGFSQIGHIIHLNLRDHLVDYKALIGQVLIDKVKTCRTVVNKSNIIDNTYRNFSMEVVAGEEDFLVTVKENRCTFQFDFSKVYWNPRLCKEHERILEILNPGDILFDVFCGVGPFAVPAAKKKCKVFANDLNPDSFKWLNVNIKNNKVNPTMFKSYNLDGKDFICNVFKDFILELGKGNEKLEKQAKIHITMNLPAMAVEFLQYFNGIVKDEELLNKLDMDIIIYVYCFSSGDDTEGAAKELVCKNMGSAISSHIVDVFFVRNVAPNKNMMRVTIRLGKEVLCGDYTDCVEPPVKKLCKE